MVERHFRDSSRMTSCVLALRLTIKWSTARGSHAGLTVTVESEAVAVQVVVELREVPVRMTSNISHSTEPDHLYLTHTHVYR